MLLLPDFYAWAQASDRTMNDLEQVKPIGHKVLIELLPLYSSERARTELELVSLKKHWDYPTRNAAVLAVGPKVLSVFKGDVVVIAGGEGKFIDDPEKIGYQKEARYLAIDERAIMAVFCDKTSAAA